MENNAENHSAQNLWRLLVSYTALGASEHWSLKYLFWLSLASSTAMTLSLLSPLVARILALLRGRSTNRATKPTRTWRRFLLVGTIVAVATASTFWMMPTTMPKGEPLLSGPPQFVILSLIAALALYLRQVNLNAIDLRYKIQHGQLWNLSPESEYADEKAERLEETSNTIMLVSPFLFALILAVCGRIICDSFSRFSYESRTAPNAFYVLDCLIAVWLSLTFLGLTIADFVVRYKDNRIQRKIRSYNHAGPPKEGGSPIDVPPAA